MRRQLTHQKEKRYVLNAFFRCEFNVQIFLQGLIVQSALLHCEVENPKNKIVYKKEIQILVLSELFASMSKEVNLGLLGQPQC